MKVITKQFKIYFSDLKPEAQKELMETVDIEDPAEMNWDMDICPLAIYEVEVEE